MDFLDEYDDGRPRIVFQSRPSPSSSTIDSSQNSHKCNPFILIISVSFSLIFLAFSIFFIQYQLLNSLFFWFSISLLVGPFAPISLTCGDVGVGQGKIVEFPQENEQIEVDESKKKVPNKRIRGKRLDLDGSSSNGYFEIGKNSEKVVSFEGLKVDLKEKNGGFLKSGGNVDGIVFEEQEWIEDDLNLLRKQIVKHPVGKPRRWEVIGEAFKGRHSVESVINTAKSLGKVKPVDLDSYSKFLMDRKPVDKWLEGGDGALVGQESGGEVISWSSGDDIALLNALKTFPKDVAMRWEKIAASVPGKTKAACMKRVSELKKEFRSSKASGEN